MEFGTFDTRECEGAILAHSMKSGSVVIKKGHVLSGANIEVLLEAGIGTLTVARLGPDDLGENEAARRISTALVNNIPGLECSRAFTGRVNIYSGIHGLAMIDESRLRNINLVGFGITLATLPDMARVAPGRMVATLKIVTYGAPCGAVEHAEAIASGTISLKSVQFRSAGLVITVNPHDATGSNLVEKGKKVVEDRLSSLDMMLTEVRIVPHGVSAIGGALKDIRGEILLILTSSATSDVQDIGPLGLVNAGGEVKNFGIPVDPGNLLFHGLLEDRPVLGLPGCARSPALNGTDWFLERIACGLEITDSDIASMGAGGLLKEIPSRPQPRERKPR